MEVKEFEKTLGQILGIKGEITFAAVHKLITTDEVKVQLIVVPTKTQRKKLMSLIADNNTG